MSPNRFTTRAEPPMSGRPPNDDSDGQWICHKCGLENLLVHFEGEQPFKRIDCGRCDHIGCADCVFTSIFEPLTLFPGTNSLVAPVAESENVRYGTLCMKCGETYRATAHSLEGKQLKQPGLWHSLSRHKEKEEIPQESELQFCYSCDNCYNTDASAWKQFHIGSCEEYRMTPEVCYAELMNRKADMNLARHAEKQAEERKKVIEAFNEAVALAKAAQNKPKVARERADSALNW